MEKKTGTGTLNIPLMLKTLNFEIHREKETKNYSKGRKCQVLPAIIPDFFVSEEEIVLAWNWYWISNWSFTYLYYFSQK